ncbi:hypothetical protein [Allobranchiibius sp. GilTou38]|uniref:hypothetical protein n=1 Tax=Allobranchiibius sp. GilTou38 TaxID=2815210 RepID=UPI001AA19CA6|nr:hypothetical protein [Allobranchiibius sp. GilTou38]MBO1768243.1 hypothetical protein [Allobranchiibius sp. GilTou38]
MNVHLLFAHPWTWITGVLLVALVHGVAPQLLLRLALACYPRRDPRRRELRADYAAVPVKERPRWVLDVLTAGLLDGLHLRVRDVRRRRKADSNLQKLIDFNLLDKPTQRAFFGMLLLLGVEGMVFGFVTPNLWTDAASMITCMLMAGLLYRLRLLTRRADERADARRTDPAHHDE